ncbi:MAG: type II toxin-antitoxin system Phd/YefM family antitoxin [Thiotrichales bacterium]
MPEIGANEFKRQFAQLLERVRRGERFTITDNGEPIAALVPVADATATVPEESTEEAQSARRKIRKRGIRLLDV